MPRSANSARTSAADWSASNPDLPQPSHPSHCREFEPDDDEPTGMWMPTATADCIFFDATASPGRREQIIGHELGHLLLDHAPRLQEAPDTLLAALAPSVS